MSDKPLVPLDAIPIQLNSPLFIQEISRWPFTDPFVGRLLRDDIPQRVKFGKGRIWAYRNPENEIVGFGTIDLCLDYGNLTGNKPHPHIPLLAVNPGKAGRGYGKSIIRHLIGEAVLLAAQPGGVCHDILFLEVYTGNDRAISLYEQHGFVKLIDNPIFDEIEQKDYFVMARRVSVAST